MNNLTLGSLFDGSGGFPLGGLISGITPVWASEIEPFPIRVTTKRLPQMKHYGDISTINGAEIGPVDIITFGSPCTDMSVAGKRAGLGGEKSVLFYEAIRIIKEMRCKTNGKYPRWAVWENVPGAFSSNKGQDFRAVLKAIAEIKDETLAVPMPDKNKWMHAGEIVGDDFSVAWRLLDAQYFGVAQRRRRIYLVADFRDRCAGKVLFEQESLRGYPSQSQIKRKRTTGDAAACAGKTISFEPGAVIRLGKKCEVERASTLRAQMGDNQTCIVLGERQHGLPISEDIALTILASDYKGTQCLFENHGSDTRFRGPIEVSQTITANLGMGGNNQPFVVSNTPKTLKIRSGCEGGGKGALVQENKSATLSCNNEQTVFVPKAYGICSDGSNSMKSDNPHSGIYEADTSRTLDGNACNPSANQGGIAIVEESCAYSFDPYNNKQDDVMPSIGTNCGMSTGRSICLQGSMIGRKDENGPNGDGINEEVSFTLDATDRHAVVYAIDRETFNCGQNFARNLGISEDGIVSTLNAQGPSAVAEPISFYPQMKAESQCVRQDGTANTIVNGTNPGYQNGIVEPAYTVRRLTPLECCRLQGFPDFWCSNLETENPTDEDIAFWAEVFETHRKIMGNSTKPKSKKQIIKWLKDPHSDSAEYKMWGNGVCKNCVTFVLDGIVQQSKRTQ